MPTINIETYSIIILTIILIDYYKGNTKKSFRFSSYLYVVFIISVIVIAILDCLLQLNISNFVKQTFLFINSLIIAIPVVCLSIYLRINYLNQYTKKTHLTINTIYLGIYAMLITLGTFICPISNKYFIYLSLLPLVDIGIKCLIYAKKNHGIPSIKLLIISFFPIIGLILDLMIKEYIFLVPTYTISALILYLYRTNINVTLDHLTRVFNRQILETENYPKQRKNKYTMFCLFDLDKFKEINDTYGHKMGDKILIDFARILKSNTRLSDYVVRYGGDEFLLIAYLTNENDQKIVINKIKNKIEEYNEKSKIKISTSIGYDIYKEGKYKSIAHFIHNIDQKMYKEKEKNHCSLNNKELQ